MPKLGADMTEGRVVEWLKKPGEPIARGEVVLVIETDKANVEVESWAAGKLEKILVEPGDAWLPVGTPLATIFAEGPEPRRAAGRRRPDAAAGRGAGPPRRRSPRAARRGTSSTPPPSERRPRLAGRAASAPTSSASTLDDDAGDRAGRADHAGGRRARRRGADRPRRPPRRTAQPRMREAIAAAMARSKREIPHYYLSTTIDFSPAASLARGAQPRPPGDRAAALRRAAAEGRRRSRCARCPS